MGLIEEINRILNELLRLIGDTFVITIIFIKDVVLTCISFIIRLIKKLILIAIDTADIVGTWTNAIMVLFGSPISAYLGYKYVGDNDPGEFLYAVISGIISVVLLLFVALDGGIFLNKKKIDNKRLLVILASIFILVFAGVIVKEFMESFSSGIISLVVALFSALNFYSYNVSVNDKGSIVARMFISTFTIIFIISLFLILPRMKTNSFFSDLLNSYQGRTNAVSLPDSLTSDTPKECDSSKEILLNNTKDIKQLQAALGMNKYLITGKFLNKTKEALMKFQTKHGMPSTGKLDECTMAKLKEVSPDAYKEIENRKDQNNSKRLPPLSGYTK